MRLLLLALILSVFSFGTLALILTPAVFVVMGYLYTQLSVAHFDMTVFFAGILTHGVIEIPAIVLATAAAFKLGAIVTEPPKGKTVGAAFMESLGDTLKIFIGLVLPGLIIAAFIESFITPRVLLALLGG